MTSALAPKILSTPSPTTGITETTAPVTLIGTVTTLVKTQPDKNTINKVSEIANFSLDSI